MQQLGTETAFEVLNKAKALEAEGRSIVHLHIGADFPLPRTSSGRDPRAARRQHRYTPARGYRLRGPSARTCSVISATVHDQVLIVPGGKPTMFYALLMFGEPGVILYPNPGLRSTSP
jgi:aspartate/methionine/tyrosine aminotransferase